MEQKMAIINMLKAAQSIYPEQRICQLINNAAYKGGWTNGDSFYCPDDVLMAGLEKMVNGG